MIQPLTRILYLIFILMPLFFSYSCGDKKRNIFNASRKQVDSNLVVINNPLTLPPFFFLPETKSSKVTDSIDKISKSNSDAILNSTTINNNANIPITNTDKEFLNLVQKFVKIFENSELYLNNPRLIENTINGTKCPVLKKKLSYFDIINGTIKGDLGRNNNNRTNRIMNIILAFFF